MDNREQQIRLIEELWEHELNYMSVGEVIRRARMGYLKEHLDYDFDTVNSIHYNTFYSPKQG